MSNLSADPVFLSTLNTWLADLVVERSDANLHVLLRLLEVLAALKAAAWAGLTAAGLCMTVKKAAGHRNRDVASKSAALLKVREGISTGQQLAVAGTEGEAGGVVGMMAAGAYGTRHASLAEGQAAQSLGWGHGLPQA